MSLLTDGKLQKIIGTTAGSSRIFGEPITIKRRSSTIDADGAPSGSFTTGRATATPTDYSAYRREQAAIPITDRQIIVYQYGATATPRAGDQLVVRGVTMQCVKVTADPAGATWDVQARPVL